jgi:pentatricopeptide repeat protein
MSLLNVDSNNNNNSNTSYLTDVGVGVVFGLGYYLIKYLYGDSKLSDQKDQKGTQNMCWESAKTIEEFNTLIKTFEGKNLNSFDVLDKINQKGLSPNITTYNNLLNLSYINSNYETADKLIEEVFDITGPVQPDLTTYNILLKGISYRIGQVEEKQELLSKMDKIISDLSSSKEYKPNDITVNTTLDILIKAGQISRAWNLFDNMKSLYNISPDKYSYSTILKAMKYDLDLNKLDKAFGILNYLKTNKNIGPQDEIIFNSLIDVCFKLNQTEKAEQVFHEMKELKVEPGRITFALMIKGFGGVYQLDRALYYYSQLKSSSLTPNEIIYGCVLNACVMNKNIRKLSQIYEEMKVDSSIKMNIILFTILIKAFGKAKNLIKASELYNDFLNSTKLSEQNIAVYNAMLDCCVECDQIAKMKEIYENIRNNVLEHEENAPQPDLITYSTVIKGYARTKDMENVFKLYDFLNRRKDFVLDEVVYNSILDGCAKTNSLEEAQRIYNDMKEQNIIRSNVTYSILVKLYSNSDMFDQAFLILSDMKENNVKPGLIVYTCLIQAAIRAKDFKRSYELFEMMKKDNVQLDQVVYNIMINNCMYNYKWDLAYQYTVESFNQNIKLADDIYSLLLHNLTSKYCNLRRNVKAEYISNILKLLKDKNVTLDYQTYQNTAKFFYKVQSKPINFPQNNNYYNQYDYNHYY